MSDILDKITAYKLREIATARQAVPAAELERRIASLPPPRGFADRIADRIAGGEYALIAEIKKASPSKGLIRADFDPAATRPGLRSGRRHLPLGSDRRALVPGRA